MTISTISSVPDTGKKIVYSDEYFKDKDVLPLHILTTLEDIIEKNGFKNILEVGCGTGRLLQALRKSGREVFGCDVSPSAARKAGASVADVTQLPYRRTMFDLVIGISLIEHLQEHEADQFLYEAKRLLRPGGCLFMVTPNFSSPLRCLMGKKWFGYSDPTHVTFYTPAQLTKKLEKFGFTDIRKTFTLDTYPDFNWGMPCTVPALNRFLSLLMISTPCALIRDSFWIMGKICRV